MTYGYYRAEIIGAMSSVVLIWGLTIWLLKEAIDRMTN
jgi:zinc transporter 2